MKIIRIDSPRFSHENEFYDIGSERFSSIMKFFDYLNEKNPDYVYIQNMQTIDNEHPDEIIMRFRLFYKNNVLYTNLENDNIPHVKSVDGKFFVENDYVFTLESPVVYHHRTWLPFQKISFLHSPDIPQLTENIDEIYELIGEKLKQDYIKLLNYGNKI